MAWNFPVETAENENQDDSGNQNAHFQELP